MGDRRNVVLYSPGEAKIQGGKIVVKKSATPIWVYTHWDGGELPTIVQKALARRERWDDYAYLNRIIASAVFKSAGIDSETGAGLSLEQCDSNYDHEVEVFHGTFPPLVRIGDKVWTFEQYVAADLSEVE